MPTEVPDGSLRVGCARPVRGASDPPCPSSARLRSPLGFAVRVRRWCPQAGRAATGSWYPPHVARQPRRDVGRQVHATRCIPIFRPVLPLALRAAQASGRAPTDVALKDRIVMLRLIAPLVLLACLATPALAADPLSVFVSVPPQETFVAGVGGEHVQVAALIRPGSNPHTCEPTPRQAAALAKAEIFIHIGMPLEGALLRRLQDVNPGMAIIDARDGLPLRSHRRIRP